MVAMILDKVDLWGEVKSSKETSIENVHLLRYSGWIDTQSK